MSDRIAVMARGDVLQIASPRDLYERPASIEVADFIGQMNFVDGSVRDIANGSAIITAAGFGDITADSSKDFIGKGRSVKVAIRPEKLHLLQQPPADGTRAVQGTIATTAYLGDRSHFYVSIDGVSEPLAVASQNVGESVAGHCEAGSEVWLGWRDESMVVLPVQ